MDSILDSVKQALGVDIFEVAFDADLVMHINTVFSTLHELDVGPNIPVTITSNQDLWTTFMETNVDLNAAKSYMVAKVRLLFDPPATSFGINALQEVIKELEWRLNVIAEGE